MSTGRNVDTSAAQVERRPEDLRRPGHRHLCRCFGCYLWRADTPNRRRSEAAAAKQRVRARRSARKRYRKTLPADDPRHGSASTAKNWGCKCAACSAALAADRSERLTRRGSLRDDDPLHGTPRGYIGWGCRCSACVAAYRTHRAAIRAEKKAQGLPVDDPRHGRAAGYNEWGCRCRACVSYNSATTAAWKAARRAALLQPAVVVD